MSLTRIEPVVVLIQIATSLYDNGLLLFIKDYYGNLTTSSTNSKDNEVQKAISNFYMIYKLIMGLTPLFSAYMLARIGARGYRKIPICVPLIGYLVSRIFLLGVIFLQLPIKLMFASAALNGLTGYYTTYWAGVMAWASQTSSESRRSLQLMSLEMLRGMASVLVNLVFTFNFAYLNITSHQSPVLVCCSITCYALGVLYSIFILRSPEPEEMDIENKNEQKPVKKHSSELRKDQSTMINIQQTKSSAPGGTLNSIPPTYIIITMFTSAILFNVGSKGTEDLIDVYVLKKPLNWGPLDVYQGKAAFFMTHITSSLGVLILSNYVSDLHMIIIGMLSFSCGVLIMAFVRWTYLYFIARAVMIFSMIPLPTIRSALSKQTDGSSHGIMFVVLQLLIEIIAVSSSAGFSKLYQATLLWFPGFCFVIFSFIGFLSVIPVCIARKYSGHNTGVL